MKRRSFLIGIALLALAAAPCGWGGDAPAPQTGLEESGFWRLTSSQEVLELVHRLDRMSPLASVERIGQSAGGRPIEALWISSKGVSGDVRTGRLRILLVGTQHGTEPSGGEALLLIARGLVKGSLNGMLERAEFIIVPNANPDGRDLHRRVNAAGVNLSTDFLLLSQPESRALNDLLIRARPEVVLDVHESAILKKKSLGGQGYLTDFEVQFEVANNPNVDEEIRGMSLTRLLPEVIALVEGRGLRAQRYIGEITSIDQPITNGGLSFRNLRNKAGLLGAFSFLLENRLDPPAPGYPSLRNIRVRVAKQMLSIEAFLEVIARHAQEVLRVAQDTRTRAGSRPVVLQVDYRLDPSHPRIAIPLRRRTSGRLVERWFSDHRAVATCHTVPLPRAYVLREHADRLLPLLQRHRLRYRQLAAGFVVEVTLQRLDTQPTNGSACEDEAAAEPPVEMKLKPGDVWIDGFQALAPLLPILLDPRSTSSPLAQPDPASETAPGRAHLVYRVEHGACCCACDEGRRALTGPLVIPISR